MQTPDIQIAIITYNHALFIETCLNSILNQKTTYNFEILVFEDCSTDPTSEILRKYKAAYPDKIKLYLSPINRGHRLNLRDNLKHLTAPYLGFIDGDDYWVDMDKVQKSLDFLKGHTDYVAYSQNVEVQQTKGLVVKRHTLHKEKNSRTTYTIKDLIAGGSYHHTSALIFRNVFMGCFPESYNHPSTGDWFFSLLFAEHGAFYYENIVGSIYRMHGDGLWSQMNKIEQRMINLECAYFYNKLLNNKYDYRFSRYFLPCAILIPRLILSRQPIMVILKYLFLLGSYPFGPFRYLPFRYVSEKLYVKLQKLYPARQL